MRTNIKTTSKEERQTIRGLLEFLGGCTDIHEDESFDFDWNDNEDHDSGMEILENRGVEYENI